MPKIKTKEVVKGTIKTLDKSVIGTKKTKDSIVNIKEKSENATQTNENSATEYATNRITNSSKVLMDNSSKIKKKGNNAVQETKSNIVKTKDKIKNIKTKLTEKKNIKNTSKDIKTASKIAKKEAKKVAKETIKAQKRARELAKESAKKTYQVTKLAVKATISAVKMIISAVKSLINALMALGWIAIIIIIVIVLVALICGSCFGIFFSGEETSANSITMKDAIIECNTEFSNRLQTIQDENPHDDYVLDGNMATWKDMLLIYTVKVSNGFEGQEVVTMDDSKKQILKDIFWDMNTLSSEVKEETVTEQGVNDQEMPTEVQKQVLHITITSKTAEEIKDEYNFNSEQLKQYNELASDDYANLWNGIIYGIDSGEYTTWRQRGATWSNIRIGTTNSTIGDIGCLVTSVAILIQKSGVDTSALIPFNPGTFVEALNNNGGFDNNGNLQYSAINKVVPNFEYVGNVNLRDKTRTEKLELIREYYNAGYYLTVEVKGATPGNQHWVAVIGIDGNNIVMIAPASEHTDMWSAYEFSKTSQFNYFKVN